MDHRGRIFIQPVLGMALLAPFANAQKPLGPAPAPSQPVSSVPASTQPTQANLDLVMILLGRVATSDGSALPNDTLVERVCDGKVRQQVHATLRGDFNMQLAPQPGALLDASGDTGTDLPSQRGVNRNPSLAMGISRYELTKCELRASANGFHPRTVSLLDLTPTAGTVDVGAIVVGRAGEVKGTMVDVTSLKAPPNARKAYEKGLEAGQKDKLSEAQKYFERAVEIYPGYESAWFQLGAVFQKENKKESAWAAYGHATAVNTRFLPPYVALASMAFEAQNWTEVLRLTNHVMDLDPLSHTLAAEYILDLDEWNPAAAYYYNAVGNYMLNRIEEAQKSALKAQHLDMRPHFPQIHALLAEIYAQKKQYALAASELRNFLELVPQVKNADEIRELLAELEKRSRATPTNEKTIQD